MIKIATKIFTASVLLLLSTAPQATPFSFFYEDTIGSTTNTNLSAGDAVKITATFDNEGSSNLSQTWQHNFSVQHLTLLTFDFDNGSLITTFNYPTAGTLFSAGGFLTDASGNLTNIFTSWTPFGAINSAGVTTNGAGGTYGWNLFENAAFNYRDADGDILLPSNDNLAILDNVNIGWTPVAVSAVPVPAAVWLMGSALIGLFGFRKKT